MCAPHFRVTRFFNTSCLDEGLVLRSCFESHFDKGLVLHSCFDEGLVQHFASWSTRNTGLRVSPLVESDPGWLGCVGMHVKDPIPGPLEIKEENAPRSNQQAENLKALGLVLFHIVAN